MAEIQRQAQKLEVSMVKTIHLRDYEKEDYSCTLTATYNRALSPEEGAVEIAKLQSELEYAVFNTLYKRKLITTHDYKVRIESIKENLAKLGVGEEFTNYMEVPN